MKSTKGDLITIIVPIYNVEKYLKECVESLISQTYDNVEIILIDDGSTDTSGKIADNYANMYKKIRIYHKKNGGLSDARNYGISKANGKYICFVDSDDFVEKDYIYSMYNNIKKHNTKIAACGYCYLYENGLREEINFQNVSRLFSGDEAQIYLNVIGYYNVSSCNKLFNRKLFDKHKFPVGKKSEDWFIMYKLIEEADSIFYDSKSKYIYRQRKGSITKSSIVNLDAIDAAEEVYYYFKNNEQVSKFAAQSYAFAVIGVYNVLLCQNKSFDIIKKHLDNIDMIRNYITYSKLAHKRKIQLFLFFHFRTIYNIVFLFYDKIRKIKQSVPKGN